MRLSALLAVALLATVSSPAMAHGTAPGLWGTYEAFLHTATEPLVLLSVLALGILAGATWPQQIKLSLIGHVTGLIAGLAISPPKAILFFSDLLLLSVTLVASLLVVVGAKPPLRWIVCQSAVAGYFIGVFSAPAPASSSTQIFMSFGICGSASLSFLFIAFSIGWVCRRWSSVAIVIGPRIVASWIAAIAALYFALFLRQALL
jgi:hypothetical protein